MSISNDGGETQTRECPTCGNELEYDVIREHGCEDETSLYMGWYCSSCLKGMVHCSECESLHHPDFECLPKREARFEAATEALGGKADIPRYGKVPLSECETTDAGDPIYRVENRCPNSECDGDLIFVLVHNGDFAEQYPHVIDYEYEAICEFCSRAEDGECSYHKP